ncbi:MAG: hypothetical protein U0176_03860 [Bacteroidia bacterium]
MNTNSELEALRQELIEQLQRTDAPDVLEEVRRILAASAPQQDWWDSLTEAQQSIVDQGLSELDAGQGIPAEEVLKSIRK